MTMWRGKSLRARVQQLLPLFGSGKCITKSASTWSVSLTVGLPSTLPNGNKRQLIRRVAKPDKREESVDSCSQRVLNAAHILATGRGAIQDRIADAALSVGLLELEDF